MRTRIQASALATIVAIAPLGASCGGSRHAAKIATTQPTQPATPRLSKLAYGERLQALGDQLAGVLYLSGQTPTQFGAILRDVVRAQHELRASASELATLRVPLDAEADNRRLVAALSSLASHLAKLKLAAQHRNARRIAAFEQSLGRSPPLQSIVSASRGLEVKGYSLGVLATGVGP